MDLNSGKLITRDIVHKIPVTDVVIKAVETMAYKQGFKSLTFNNRHGGIFHDADWIAGVDYDDSYDENEEDDDEEYHHEAENSKNKNRLMQTRSTLSPQMQERMPIQLCLRKKINRNHWKQ
jgi:hypothetical protein